MSFLSLEAYRKHRLIYHLVMWAGLAVYIVCGQCQSCRITKELRVAEQAYAELQAKTEAAQKVSDAIIAAKTEEAATALAEADALRQQTAKDRVTIAQQATLIAHLQATEPPTTPEIEAMPIVISLRAQVRELTIGFNLAQETVQRLDLENTKLRVSLAAKDIIIGELQAKYDREHALRLLSEELGAQYKKTLASYRWKGTVKTAIIGGLAAGLIYSFVR